MFTTVISLIDAFLTATSRAFSIGLGIVEFVYGLNSDSWFLHCLRTGEITLSESNGFLWILKLVNNVRDDLLCMYCT
jgi:hypothetical protein